jgi:hypothetical protein
MVNRFISYPCKDLAAFMPAVSHNAAIASFARHEAAAAIINLESSRHAG